MDISRLSSLAERLRSLGDELNSARRGRNNRTDDSDRERGPRGFAFGRRGDFDREDLLEQLRERREARREARRSRRGDGAPEVGVPENPGSVDDIEDNETPEVEPPTDTEETTPVRDNSDLQGLAELYVQQLEDQGGRALTEESRQELVNEVYDFYSAPARQGRLQNIVF